mmetsp:Transcript_39291/g.99021  ORF Transcript_39291/g.99021 Transcript_39291/m.99021 type:complete len:394 (-) Transcript_39291:73-1254(-)
MGVQTTHGDATFLGEIDVELGAKTQRFRLANAQVGEHADLVDHVFPVAWRAVGHQRTVERLSHLLDTVAHHGQLATPLCVQRLITQDLSHDVCSVLWRVRVHRPDDGLELTLNGNDLISSGSDKAHSTAALTVQTKVLGKALTDGRLHSGTERHEATNGRGVSLQVTGGEALVGHIEERKETATTYDLVDAVPLRIGEVVTSGVVGTGLQHDERTTRSGLEVCQHALDVHAAIFGIVVAVGAHLVATVQQDLLVVAPGGVAHVGHQRRGKDRCRARAQQLHGQPERTGSADALRDGNTAFCQRRTLRTVHKLGGQRTQLGQTIDREVLLVHILGQHAFLRLTNTGKHVGKIISSAVRTHREVDLVRGGIGTVLCDQIEDGIRWGYSQAGKHTR